MDSPPDPESPISRSSESPPPEEFIDAHFQDTPFLRENTPNSGKRRLPGGGIGAGSSAKSRRRDEAPLRRATGGPANWSQGGGDTRETGGGGGGGGGSSSRSQKEELVDTVLVERLRVEWGDPFDDSAVINAS